MFVRLILGLIGLGVITDPNAVYSKWQSKTSAAQQDWVDAVAASTKDPTALAIANQSRLLNNFQQAVNSGKWANRLRAAGKQGWQQGVANKASSFSAGVNNAQAKFVASFGPLLTYENGLQQQVDAMPNVTDADRENRMLAWVRGMRQYTG